MTISLDNALGIHTRALEFRAQRATLLASNLANADTPNYKARDLDFASVLAGLDGQVSGMTTTNRAHHEFSDLSGQTLQPLYRMPMQPSLDGNTVDTQIEQSEFLENAIAYQASLTFLNRKFAGLQLAIRGE